VLEIANDYTGLHVTEDSVVFSPHLEYL
jgi:hypothetical protein